MIHAAAPHFLWPFAVQYAAHQINLQPRVSLPETTPTLRWTGKVGDASAFRVRGSRAFVRDTSADKLSSRAPLSPQRLCEWYPRRCRRATGAAGAGAAGGAAGAGGAGGATGAGATRGAAGAGAAGGATGAGAAGGAASAGAAGGAAGAGATGGTAGAGAAGGAAGAVGAAGPGGARTGGTGAAGAGGTAGVGSTSTEAGGAAGVVTGDPGAEGTGAISAVSGGAARPRPYYVLLLQQPESRPVSPVSRTASPLRTARAGRVLRPRPPPVPGTHSMTLRPSTAPQRVPLPSPRASSLPDGPDPESDSLRAASPAVTRFLATAEDLECFAAASPHLVSMLLAPEGEPDALDIPTPRSYAEVIEGPYSSQWQAAMDAEMASWKSTGTYVDEVPPPGANIVNGMWIFRVKRPPGSPPAFKARYVARGFNQRHTAFLQGSLHEEIWLRRPPGFTGTTLAALGFAPSTADPSLFSCTDTTLPPFYVLVAQRTVTLTQSHMVQQVLQRFGFTYSSPQSTPPPTGHSLSAPPLDESVEPSGPYPELVGCLMYLMTCTRPDLAYPLSLLARYVAPGRHRKCLEDGLELSSLVTLTPPGSSCEAEIYAGAMATQELCWLTYLLTDLGEAPRSPPVLYVDNKAMLALCQEHILEHRTKHIALRYFLGREL
ncbi:unnamed protein product [Closterium sp. NIES-53]